MAGCRNCCYRFGLLDCFPGGSGFLKLVCDYSLIASKNFIWSFARLGEKGKVCAALFTKKNSNGKSSLEASINNLLVNCVI